MENTLKQKFEEKIQPARDERKELDYEEGQPKPEVTQEGVVEDVDIKSV